MRSPRATSMSSVRRSATERGAKASVSSPSAVSMPAMVVRWPPGRTRMPGRQEGIIRAMFEPGP